MSNDPPKDPLPYELEAPEPTPPPTPHPAHSPRTPVSPLGESVLKDFDEDDDFDRDPEREAAQRAKPSERSRTKSTARPGNAAHDNSDDETDADEHAKPFVTPGLGGANVWGIVGGFLLVGAVVTASINAAAGGFPVALLTLYSGVLHTATGLAAVYLTARLAPKPMGSIELAAARIFAAVAAFLLVFSLNIRLVGQTKWEELLLAVAVYVGAVKLLFRLDRESLMRLTLAHFLLWAIIEIGMHLSAWAHRASAVGATVAGAAASGGASP
jgi:hypothetical protein